METNEVLAQELGEGREDAWKVAQAIYEIAARTEERLTEGPWMEADKLGELSWTPYADLIATVRKQVEEMRAVRMSTLPIHRLGQVKQHCESLKATAEAIQAFSIREDNAAKQQVGLVMSLRQQYEKLLEEVGPWMAFARSAGNPARTAGEDVQGLAAQASELVADMQGLKGKAEEELARSVQRTQEVELKAMGAMRDVAERSGAAAFADGFEAECRRNGVKAIAWLSGAGLALLVEVNWLLFGLRGPPMSTPLQNDDLHRWFVFAAVAGHAVLHSAHLRAPVPGVAESGHSERASSDRATDAQGVQRGGAEPGGQGRNPEGCGGLRLRADGHRPDEGGRHGASKPDAGGPASEGGQGRLRRELYRIVPLDSR